jgi:hypothetical protein
MARETVDDNLGRAASVAALNLAAAEHELAMRLPSELDGADANPDDPHAPLFLCLDLMPAGFNKPPDEADTVPKLLLWVAAQQATTGVNSRFYPEAKWRVFTDLDAATRHADNNPTVVMMPLHIEANPELGF